MNLLIDEEFRKIAQEIIAEKKSENEWIDIESSDMFQSAKYCGGFDATEIAFTFSAHKEEQEFWFQLTLSEMEEIASGGTPDIQIRPAE